MEGYLVIGIGRFGKSVARTLYENNKTVLAIDENEEVIQHIIDNQIVGNAVVLNATDENALKKVINNDFDTAFVCIGTDIQSSILITVTLKELGIKKIICKARTEKQGKVLEKIGADMVVYPEREMGETLAKKIMNPKLTDYFKFSEEYNIFEFEVPEEFIGKNLKELDLRNKYEMNIIGIKQGKEHMNISPNSETVIEKGNILLVITNNKKKDSYKLDYVIQNMIQYSDNTATNMLMGNSATASVFVVKYLSELGVTLPQEEAQNNRITPAMMEVVWTKLYKERDKYPELIKYLEDSDEGEWIKEGISNKKIASKYGALDANYHDTAIVFGDEDYMLLIYTNNLSNSGQSIKNIAKKIDEITNKNM